jgi:hypothetical protein
MKAKTFSLLMAMVLFWRLHSAAAAFEGRINAVMTQGRQTNAMLYTVGANLLRVEMTATNWPNPVDVLDLQSGALTLFFPLNRSFMHLKPAAEDASASTSGMPAMPMPPGIGPKAQPVSAPGFPAMPNMPGGPAMPPGIGPQAGSTPGMPAMPAVPMMPMPEEKLELKATGQTTNILGFTCQGFELKQRRETMEIWATDQLPPYQPYVRNQPRRFGPPWMEEQWPAMLTSRKLFPLLATLRYEKGPARFRFEVTAVTPAKLTGEDAKLFRPPTGYFEIQPPPF